jgi:hypothetical protein
MRFEVSRSDKHIYVVHSAAHDTLHFLYCNRCPSPRGAARVGLTSIFLEQPIRLTSLCRVVTSALTHVRRQQTACY